MILKWGIFLGLIEGVFVFIFSVYSIFTGNFKKSLEEVTSYFPLWNLKFPGIIFSFVYGFIDGFITGIIIGYIITKLKHRV